MPTDDERREVARRLREKHAQRAFDFMGQCMGLQLESLAQDIIDCIQPERSTLLTLADLIDPDLSKISTVFDNSAAESAVAVKGRTVDRDALLKLADELEGLKPVIVLDRHARCEYARLIREALGVES